ncbi:MAG: hypothetical protein HRT38_10620 [Alteromonadaceae bacterium]|nr:hypothetical protein [Alteromonadaceae bacterium]
MSRKYKQLNSSGKHALAKHSYFILILSLISLSACYRVWQDVESYANKIKCDNTQAELIVLAQPYGANAFFDLESQSLQVQKESDTVVIQFHPNGKVSQVSVFKVELQFFGFHRRQVTPFIVLDCSKRNL